MNVELLPIPVDSDSGFGDDLDHYYCECDENLALCGADLTDWPEGEAETPENECVVCAHLSVCPKCGHDFTEGSGNG